jgi:hypothetical protein
MFPYLTFDKQWFEEYKEEFNFTYNQDIDEDIIKVLSFYLDDNNDFMDGVKNKFGFDLKYIELIQTLLCSYNFLEYGTSPRCPWITKEGKEFLTKLDKEC